MWKVGRLSEKYNVSIWTDKISSQLEGSIFKKIMKNLIFQLQNLEYFTTKIKQKNFRKNKLSIVIKADNLASGKGVFICEKKEESIPGSR